MYLFDFNHSIYKKKLLISGIRKLVINAIKRPIYFILMVLNCLLEIFHSRYCVCNNCIF